jgi:hypothetical protein
MLTVSTCASLPVATHTTMVGNELLSLVIDMSAPNICPFGDNLKTELAVESHGSLVGLSLVTSRGAFIYDVSFLRPPCHPYCIPNESCPFHPSLKTQLKGFLCLTTAPSPSYE